MSCDGLRACRRYYEDAHRFYVHAGFRPGRPGPDPSEHVRLWMREPHQVVEQDLTLQLLWTEMFISRMKMFIHEADTRSR